MGPGIAALPRAHRPRSTPIHRTASTYHITHIHRIAPPQVVNTTGKGVKAGAVRAGAAKVDDSANLNYASNTEDGGL